MVDFEILDGVSTGTIEDEKLELGAAMALFYHEPENDDLLPVAIQLGQTPGPDCPIWTPNDTRDDWLQAKFWFRNADAQVGQLVTHLAQTHFFVEVSRFPQLYISSNSSLDSHLRWLCTETFQPPTPSSSC